MARRPAVNQDSSKFTEAKLRAVAKDIQSGRTPLNRVTLSDEIVTGLRAVIYKSGMVSFAVSYHFGGERPFLKLGSLNRDADDYISIPEARDLAKSVKALAEKGIDVQQGLHARLIRELKKEGANWRPK